MFFKSFSVSAAPVGYSFNVFSLVELLLLLAYFKLRRTGAVTFLTILPAARLHHGGIQGLILVFRPA